MYMHSEQEIDGNLLEMVGAKLVKEPETKARSALSSCRKPGENHPTGHLQLQESLIEGPCKKSIQEILMDQSQSQDTTTKSEPATQIRQGSVRVSKNLHY